MATIDDLVLARHSKQTASRTEQRDATMRFIFAKPGRAGVVAEHLGVTRQNVSGWKQVPAHFVLEIAPLLGMSPEEIRPDVFGKKRK